MINIIDRVKLLFRKDKGLYSSLYEILGFFPHDIDLYKQALAHSSSDLRSKNGKKLNNERLEFLGDAIIEAVTSDIVYNHFTQKREGFLTTTRSKLVQRETLNKLSEEVGLKKLILSDEHNTGHNNCIGGNAFEALVGAIYLDRGYKYCLWFLRRRIIAQHMNIDKVARKEVNFKSKLLEWTQKNRFNIDFTFDESPAHDGNPTTFHSTVLIEEVVCGKGKGFSKKESQQKAAKEALYRLRQNKKALNEVLASKEKRTAIEQEVISLPPQIDAAQPDTAKSGKAHRHTSVPKRAPAHERDASKAMTTPTEQGETMHRDSRSGKHRSLRENMIAEAETKAFAQAVANNE